MENKKVFFLVLALLASTFLLVSAYYFFVKKSVGLPGLKGEPKIGQEETGPSGKIYLSLLTFSDGDKVSKQFDKVQDKRAGVSALLDVYHYDFKSSELKKLSRDAGDGNGYATGVISPDGKRMALSGFDSASGEWQIYVADADGKNKKKITSSPSVWKGLPRWSSDQKQIVFQAGSVDKKDIKTSDIYKIENWNIYLTDMEGQERMIFPKATNPLFLPDDRLLVLNSSGLVIFDKKDDYNRGVPIWPTKTKTKADASMKVGISNDGRYIAWAETGVRKIHVAKVSSWGPPMVFETIKSLDGAFSFPVFSPDNKYLALLEFFQNNPAISKNYDNQRVNVYDLSALLKSDQKMEPKVTFDLKDYYVGGAAITDWTK